MARRSSNGSFLPVVLEGALTGHPLFLRSAQQPESDEQREKREENEERQRCGVAQDAGQPQPRPSFVRIRRSAGKDRGDGHDSLSSVVPGKGEPAIKDREENQVDLIKAA